MPRTPEQIDDAHLRLALTSGIGPVTYRRLMARLGGAAAIVGASATELAAVEGIGPTRAVRLKEELARTTPDAERDAMSARGVGIILRGDSDYPPLLESIADPPVALWVRGTLAPEDSIALAIVGSRHCSAYGRDQAARFASMLAQCGLTIVSGGARGIDAEAHRAALRAGGRTIAVCGCGLAHDYPPEHADLFMHIVERGAVVSEYPMGVMPRSEHFPRRNRIISGLSLGVLVIEAGRGSGALITARLAAEEHGREVMALPGRVDSPSAMGCLEAIRDGWAGMVLSHADVLTQLESAGHLVRGAFEAAAAPPNGAPSLRELNLTDGQRAIVAALQDAETPLLTDFLAHAVQMPPAALLSEITILEIRGLVARDERGVRLKRRTPEA
ncbi:MAG: DNA-protecting protein DprA [Phycisphaeraceae bacterium]|nr:DNA-processing protein DprA [Phycisphaerales bacterium]QOJ17939.1 MAG: DNA-protecting protein DprA [Phycisphaeraceae bacterium]